MTDSEYLPPVRLEAHRERVVAELAEHFAHDHLDTQEFEARLDRAYQARRLEELDRLKADLPALRPDRTPAAPVEAGVEIAPADEVPNRQVVFAVMGGTERKGAWTVPETLDVIAFMGGVELDFREARFGPGVTQINTAAIMGGIEIRVPPGVRVQSQGMGIMGGFASLDQHADPSAPLLRITGVALMGAVEVEQRLPGESKSAAKRRRQLERREERHRLKRGPE